MPLGHACGTGLGVPAALGPDEGKDGRGLREEGQRGRDEREEVRRMNEMDDWLRIICKCEK
jgi:hypothetical protein